MTTLCLLAIFKNESHILKEWIEHYLNQGVDKIFLVDNGSTDSYYSILQPYISTGKVDLVKDNKKYAQVELYNKHFLHKCKAYDWVIVCDLDEFIYGRKYCNSIKEFLSKVHDSFSQVFIPWKMFGSNGYDTMEQEQPSSVISTFTKRINNNDVRHNRSRFFTYKGKGPIKCIYSKCIVRTKYLLKIDIHYSETSNNRHITSCVLQNNYIHPDKHFTEVNEYIIEHSALHLNHYAIQSFNWFMKVKATRGDINSANNDNVRNKEYFKNFDFNDIDDSELSNITNNKNISS
jgi:hypothetical protein